MNAEFIEIIRKIFEQKIRGVPTPTIRIIKAGEFFGSWDLTNWGLIVHALLFLVNDKFFKVTEKQHNVLKSQAILQEGYIRLIIHDVDTNKFEEFLKTKHSESENSNEQANKNTDSSKSGVFPHKLPAGTRWENFVIKFLDKDNVEISIKKITHAANFSEMGFEDKRNSKPNKKWILFEILSRLPNGELTLKNPEADPSFKKTKELLTETLQSYFKIDYDPFFPYKNSLEKRGNSYKIKMTLFSQPESKPNQNKKSETIIHQEIGEMFEGLQVLDESEINQTEA